MLMIYDPDLFRGVYTCTTSGHLRLTPRPTEETVQTFHKASLPMRLCDFHLSANQKSFAYGGDEVDLSVWDAEAAFASSSASLNTAEPSETKKRKKPSSNDLLPGEIWRAKNVSLLSFVLTRY